MAPASFRPTTDPLGLQRKLLYNLCCAPETLALDDTVQLVCIRPQNCKAQWCSALQTRSLRKSLQTRSLKKSSEVIATLARKLLQPQGRRLFGFTRWSQVLHIVLLVPQPSQRLFNPQHLSRSQGSSFDFNLFLSATLCKYIIYFSPART